MIYEMGRWQGHINGELDCTLSLSGAGGDFTPKLRSGFPCCQWLSPLRGHQSHPASQKDLIPSPCLWVSDWLMTSMMMIIVLTQFLNYLWQLYWIRATQCYEDSPAASRAMPAGKTFIQFGFKGCDAKLVASLFPSVVPILIFLVILWGYPMASSHTFLSTPSKILAPTPLSLFW